MMRWWHHHPGVRNWNTPKHVYEEKGDAPKHSDGVHNPNEDSKRLAAEDSTV